MAEFDKFDEVDVKNYPLVYINSRETGVFLPGHKSNVIIVYLPKNEHIYAGIPLVSRKRFDRIVGTYSCTSHGNVIIHPKDELLAKKLPYGFSLDASFMVDDDDVFYIAIENYTVDLYEAPKDVSKIELGSFAAS